MVYGADIFERFDQNAYVVMMALTYFYAYADINISNEVKRTNNTIRTEIWV